LIPGWYLAAARLLHSRTGREKYMSGKDKKAKNFHVRFRDDQAEWLHNSVEKSNHRNVPEKIRKLVDREMIKEELRNERPKPKR
jgi:hypothetical protein